VDFKTVYFANGHVEDENVDVASSWRRFSGALKPGGYLFKLSPSSEVTS